MSTDIWVSTRTDGISGTGTATDPYDLSTAAKFDTFMNTTLPSLGSGIVVNFKPGIYLTYGTQNNFAGVQHGFALPGGNWYRGSGIGETTIRQAFLPDSHQWTVFQTYYGANNVNTVVTDMTIDANFQNLSAPAASVANHIALNGDFCMVQRVSAINGYGNKTAALEAFNIKISSWLSGGVSQPITGARVEYCIASQFRGNYGTAIDIFSIGSIGTAAYPAQAVIANNYISGYVGDNISISTGGIGFVGQGLEICNNIFINCDQAIYLEGPFKDLHIHHNDFYNIRSGAIIFNTIGSNEGQNVTVHDNNIEVNTAISGTANNSTKVGITGINGSSNTVAGKYAIYNNRIKRLLAGVGTVSRSRSSNVATLVTSANHGLNNGDRVDTASLGGTGYNAQFNTVAVVNATTFTFASVGPNEATTADAGGTIGMSTSGLSLNGSAAQLSVHVYDNLVDSQLFNLFSWTLFPVDCFYKNNKTFEGSCLTLQPASLTGNFMSLPSEIEVPVCGDPVTNASALLSAYLFAQNIYPNGVAPSPSNRVSIMVRPGQYSLADGQLILSQNFIDVVGVGQREHTLITSPGNTITINCPDYRLKGLSIKTTSTSATKYALFRIFGGGRGVEVLEDLVISSAGAINTINNGGPNNFWDGAYRNITFTNGGFFAQGQGEMGGVAENITIGPNGTNNVYVSTSGVLRNFRCFGQLNLYRNDGVIEYGSVVCSSGNTDAVIEQNNGASGGIYRYLTLVAHGTGKSIKNTGGSRSTAVYLCGMNAGLDGSITNLISVPNNVVDSVNITA